MSRILFLKTAIIFFCLQIQLITQAQVCTGSLGDPVVNVTFGKGSNPGNNLQAATTTYSFTSAACPSDGSYTVVNSTSGCFGNTWHTVSEDHTPNDANGYMMLVNASFVPGDFYVDTVKGLCAGTKYEFAAWIMNVILPASCNNAPISPKLIFNIETPTGTVLSTFSTGDILATSSPVWKQYGLFFSTPINSSTVVIRLTNTAPGGCGNDLILDDITFRPCGPNVSASAPGGGQAVVDMCAGSVNTVPILATVGTGFISPSFQWQQSLDSGITWSDIAGATTINYLFNETSAGIYKYRMAVAEGTNISISNCRVASNPFSIVIHDLPVVAASSNSPVCEETQISLNATGGSSYTWTGPAGFTSLIATPQLIAQTSSTGLYNVAVTDQFGCKNNGSASVIVYPKPVATISGTQRICEGFTTALQAGGGGSYLWSPAAGLSATDISNPVASPTDTTQYTLVISGANNCRDTATVTVNVLKKPVASAGPDKILLKGQTVVLEGSVSGSNINYAWSPSVYLNNPLDLQPVSAPLNDISYTLKVTSNDGCGEAADTIRLKVYNDIYIPSAFSPNGDGLNDTWKIEALIAAPKARVLVFNRFGAIIFETSGNSREWDGTYKAQLLPSGAYAYMIDLRNGRPIKRGMVMLIR